MARSTIRQTIQPHRHLIGGGKALMLAPRFRHPVVVLVGIFLFLFQSAADAREVGCRHHSAVQPADHAPGHSPASHSQHSHSVAPSADAHGGAASHDLATGADNLPAGERCDCGPLCSGLVGPPPEIPEMCTRLQTSWSSVVLVGGTGVEVMPVHRIRPALLDLPPPPSV